MGSFLFWMQQSPGGPDQTEWMVFLNTMSGWLVFSVLVAALIASILYLWLAVRKKIISVDALFSQYEPMWPFWIGIPVVFFTLVVACHLEAKSLFAEFSSIYYGVTLGLAAAVMYAVIAYVTLLLLTPQKFKYRPLQMFLRSPR